MSKKYDDDEQEEKIKRGKKKNAVLCLVWRFTAFLTSVSLIFIV